jgi:hypothetical protein
MNLEPHVVSVPGAGQAEGPRARMPWGFAFALFALGIVLGLGLVAILS